MAKSSTARADAPAPTRPRLQSVNQDFSHLNEQIRQVAHIIRLPDDWNRLREEEAAARASALQHVVRARAEWVLRWLLDKLNDETAAGAEARASPAAWQLLECMIHILPVSRSALHLRDAAFTTILEHTLVENFDKHLDSPSSRSHDDLEMRDESESSETVHEDSQPSRKRKRGTAAPSPSPSPSKKTAIGATDPAVLFSVVKDALYSITHLATADGKSHDSTQVELMKMVLRTESAQASRILKFWLIAVQKLLARICAGLDQLVDFSIALEIWGLRIVDASDSTASSSEDFANQCLVPTLCLVEDLKELQSSQSSQGVAKSLDTATQALDKLLTRHIIAPSRAAFFTKDPAEAAREDPTHREALALLNSLGPLQAMLLQAAQIEDAGEAIPASSASLFKAIPYLLDLAIRASPSKTPKARLAEKAWIQAVFLSLAACTGCSLKTPPEFVTPKTAVAALQGALEVLQSHNMSMNVMILKNLFWYHCGVKYPERPERQVHWGLIAALIELDASIFVVEPRSSPAASEHPNNLAQFLFELISDTESKGNGFAGDKQSDDDAHGAANAQRASRTLILNRIVVPVMCAFARNRSILGFIRLWDDQLVRSHKCEKREVFGEKVEPIWQDRILAAALSELFEQSLTQSQIAKLVEEHAKRMDELSSAVLADDSAKVHKLPAYKMACSSAVIIPAILQSIQADEAVDALKTQLHSLFTSYMTRVRDDRFIAHTQLPSSWLTLCQLMVKLWPAEIHATLKLQQMLLHPLIEQANEDLSAERKSSEGRQIDSRARAAAILFLLHACYRLQDVSGSEEQVQNSARNIVKTLSASQLETEEHVKIMGIFSANFVQLLNGLDADASRESFITLLSRLTAFDHDIADQITRSLPEAIFATGNSALHSAYSSALSGILEQTQESSLKDIAIKATFNLQPAAISRERREAILDRVTMLSSIGSFDLAGLLAAMVQLMSLPNASAKISTDGAILFEIANQVRKQGLGSRSVLQSLQHLCQQTLSHIIPNQTQAQSRAFLAEYQKKLDKMTQSSSKVSPVGLALLRATILEQKDTQLLSVKQYVALLKKCLIDDGAEADETASFEDVLDAFNELYPALLVDANLLKSTTTWLRTWIKENADLESYITSSNSVSAEVAEYVARLHKLVAKFKLYPDMPWLITLTVRVLRESMADESKRSALSAITEASVSLEIAEKLALIPFLTDAKTTVNQPASYLVLNSLISTLPDKITSDAETKKKQLALLPKLCILLAETSNEISFNALMDSIVAILNSKASLTTQHSIECVLSVLVKLTSRTSPALSSINATHIYTRICETSRLVLLVHRSKLGGRSHLLIPLLQNLLFLLFIPTSSRNGALPSWRRSNFPTEAVRPTPLNSNQYARLLSTLCNPPQSSISKTHQHGSRKSKDLNDPIKAARERTSHFLYPLLTSYCRFQLTGRLDPEVRKKLIPGIWDVVGTASLHREGLDAMFAGLGRAEKDLWRGVWGEYEATRGRKERFIGGEEA